MGLTILDSAIASPCGASGGCAEARLYANTRFSEGRRSRRPSGCGIKTRLPCHFGALKRIAIDRAWDQAAERWLLAPLAAARVQQFRGVVRVGVPNKAVRGFANR